MQIPRLIFLGYGIFNNFNELCVMERLFAFIITVLLLASCGSGKNGFRNGDLIFVGIPLSYSIDSTSMDSAIAQATGTEGLNLIHVAIVEIEGDSTFVIDATIKRGVDRHPLDTFIRDFTLKDGSLPVLELMRLKDPRDADIYVANAHKFIGLPYDERFMPDNGAYYCSELVRDSYIRRDGTYIFDAAPMNFKASDGEYPVYWKQLFARLGVPIPQGVEGTNPQDMYGSKAICRICSPFSSQDRR